MSDDQFRLLTLSGQPPARLNAEQVAFFINCAPHDIPVLVRAKLLKPLGNPPLCAVKFFATQRILELVKSEAWLARVTAALYEYWQGKNGRRTNHSRDRINGASAFQPTVRQWGRVRPVNGNQPVA